MGDGILQGFLNRGLIDVGGDDAKLDKLNQAAGDLAAALKKNPSKALGFSLIAFDPDAPEADPIVQEALAALQKRWTTYRNTFSATPIAVIRAMLLDALVASSADDDRVGVCFVASARNALPLLPVDNEREIWIGIVEEVERRVDLRAEAEWATPENLSVQPLKYDAPKLNAVEVEIGEAPAAALRVGMMAAAGPQYHNPQQGNVATNGNPQWPQNSPTQWVSEFGQRAGTTIAKAIDTAIGEIKVSQPDLTQPFAKLAEAVSGYVDETLKTVSAATAGLQRRTNLLWWREALFSPSVGRSYRTLPPSVAAALMALDLFDAVPLFSPASVSAFLGEAVLRLEGIADGGKRTVRDLVKEAQDEATLAPLRAAAAKLAAEPAGRGPLLALIGYPTHTGARDVESFQRLTGVPADSELDTVAWAGWLFRELQASKAATDASPARRGAARKG
ncbi:GTPase-associated system all-helical protein GASH [Sphingobium scionense]